MNKLALLALALLPCLASAQSQISTYTFSATGTSPSTFVDSTEYHTVEFAFSGTPTACTARLEGSVSGTSNGWADLSGTVSCMPTVSGAGMFSVGGPRAVRYVRLVLVSFTGTGTATTTYWGTNR